MLLVLIALSFTAVAVVAPAGSTFSLRAGGDWALSIAKGAETWNNSGPLEWDQEISRFHAALNSFDNYLASEAELNAPCERLFQGPIADALTHVGQLTMLRRIAGAAIKAENYSRAKIESGHVGAEQAAPKREFD